MATQSTCLVTGSPGLSMESSVTLTAMTVVFSTNSSTTPPPPSVSILMYFQPDIKASET